MIETLGLIDDANPLAKAVISVYGGSGVGKSEIASILSYYLSTLNIGSYILSGDNYLHRIPMFNDAERLRIFRCGGLEKLIAKGKYTLQVRDELQKLQIEGVDSDFAQADSDDSKAWLSTYQKAGYLALQSYLGTSNELNLEELSSIVTQFKSCADKIWLKRMGREPHELWYEQVDMSDTKVLFIEWTHGNNENLYGVDIPIYLHSTLEQTLTHCKKRNRDSNTESHFICLVLKAEQELLRSQEGSAFIVVE